MSEVITLSSSDEEDAHPPLKKRIKPTSVSSISGHGKERVPDIVILSDDETENNLKKSCAKNFQNGQLQTCLTNSRNENSPVTVLDNENSPVTVLDNENEFYANPSKISHVGIHNDENNESSDSIIIDENSSAGSSGKENQTVDMPKNHDDSEPSTSFTLAKRNELLETFLEACRESIVNSKYEYLQNTHFLTLRKYYMKCGAKLEESKNFIKLMEENVNRAKKSASTAVISFDEIFRYVKEVVNKEAIEVSKEVRIKLKKLEKAMELLVRKIKHLENSEVNFDEEEDSNYLKLERYINRLNKVHNKYCELLNKNPNCGRITYEKLDFVCSEYNDINRAISKKYRNKFPSYYEMEEFIRKVVSEHNLDLSEARIKSESVRCFKKLGELLQKRRKKDLYEAHYLYVRDSEDPANVDKSLDTALKQSYTEGQIKIEKIYEEFSVKEELGGDVEVLSEESENSEDSEGQEMNEDV